MDMIFHILIPYLVLRLFGINHKYLFPLAFIAVLPDFGRFIGYYRESHSLILVMMFSILFFLVVRRELLGKFTSGVVFFYLLSHLFLDLGTAMGLFWPLDLNFYAPIIAVKIVNGLPVLEIGLKTLEAVTRPSVEYIIKPEAFGFLSLLVLLALYFKAQIIKKIRIVTEK